jgi:hypothetical protein
MVQHTRQPPLRLIRRREDIVMFVDGRIDARSQQVVAETVDELWTQPFDAPSTPVTRRSEQAGIWPQLAQP